MKSLRLWYEKSGTAIYISHLDMNRCFQRAVTRAKLPLWFTEGFNPHPYMTFLAPLPLGQTALREPIDIRITEEMGFEEIKEKLNAVLPVGIRIVDVTDADRKANDIFAADYELCCEFISEDTAKEFTAKTEEMIKSGTVEAEKRSKKGLKTVNLCTMIHGISFELTGNVLSVKATLSAGNTENLNPQLLVDALSEKTGIEPEQISILRKAILFR